MTKIIAMLFTLAALFAGGCATFPSLPPCPGGVVVTLNVRSLAALPQDLRQQAEMLIRSAEGRNSGNAGDPGAYGADDVSRTLGYRLRTEVNPAAVNADVQVNLRDLKAPRSFTPVKLVPVVQGTGKVVLPDNARSQIVEFVWLGDFVSPTASAGEQRMWVLPREWKTCREMNVTALVR